jgi:hypothetical protein
VIRYLFRYLGPAMMRQMAHFCIAVSAESDANATPMRHRFGPKRRRFAMTAKKPFGLKPLP